MKFAFIMHPLVAEDVYKLEDWRRHVSNPIDKIRLKFISENVSDKTLEAILKRNKPVIVDEFNAAGNHGYLIAVTLTAKQMLDTNGRSDIVPRKIKEAVQKAMDLEAEVIGLGACTSIATEHGNMFKDISATLTTGRPYTAAVVSEQIKDYNPIVVDVIGNSSIGNTLSKILRRQGYPVNLMSRREVDKDKLGNMIVTATTAQISLPNLKRHQVVIDVGMPPNVAIYGKARYIPGGLVQLPIDIPLEFNFGFGKGIVPACLAETIILAMAKESRILQNQGHYCIGRYVPIDKAAEIYEIGKQYGFTPAKSFIGLQLR